MLSEIIPNIDRIKSSSNKHETLIQELNKNKLENLEKSRINKKIL